MRSVALSAIFFISLLLVGCQGGAGNAPPETFSLRGQKVEFAPPPAEWKRNFQKVTAKDAELGLPEGTVLGLTFEHPEGKGFLVVSSVEAATDQAGKPIPLQSDQDTLNKIAMWVVKREGEIRDQKYIKVDGQEAYRMEFAFGQNETAEKGVQIHFTKGSRHYTIALTMPASKFDAALPVFNKVAETFQVKG